jgi:EmrB/QacA subfamily drug resistance transporter
MSTSDAAVTPPRPRRPEPPADGGAVGQRVSIPLALLVAGAFFMENLDGTIIATAAPKMAGAFSVAPADIGITMTAYLVTVAALIPVSGWAAERWGARRTFTLALVGFTAASAWCAASTSLPELTGVRILQGAAGAMMVPVGRLVVLRLTGKSDLIRVIAYLTWPGLVASVAAPVLGGVFATYLSWRWIFLVNLPLGVIAVAVALRIVPRVPGRRGAGLDRTGFVLVGTALAAVMYAASLLGEDRTPWPLCGGCAVMGAALAAWGLRHLIRTPRPLVDLTAFRVRTFRVAHAGGSLYRGAVFAVPFLLPLMFQDAFGWTPLRAGSMVVFVFVGNLAIKPATGPLLRRLGFRAVLVASATALAVATALIGLLTAHTAPVLIALLLVAGGAFRSIGFTGYNTIAFADIAPESMTHANTLSSTVQQLAQGLGVAVGGLLLRAGEAVSGPSSLAAYRLAFAMLAVFALLAAAEAAALPRDAGAHLGAASAAGPVRARRS